MSVLEERTKEIMSEKRDVVITGMGVLSPIGLSVAEGLSSLSSARSGIAECEDPPLEKKFPAGVVPWTCTDQFTKLEFRYWDRCQQMAICTARKAISAACLANSS